MKKTIAAILTAGLLITAVNPVFAAPNWGALLNEKTAMVKEKDFELYVEGSVENAPYYGAKYEPRGGAYIGMTGEILPEYEPLGSYLTYDPSAGRSDAVTLFGWTMTRFDDVNYDSVRSACEMMGASGKPIFLRYANEMNVFDGAGETGSDPERYKEVFRTVANIAHEYPNIAVVWSPNDLGALDKPFDLFYPGDEYVDWIGVSSYQKMYFLGNKNTSYNDSIYFMTGNYAWTTNAVKPIIEFMQKNNIEKPLMISEGGVTTANSAGDSAETIEAWSTPRLRNMYYNLIMKYPQIKMINYFNHWMPESQTYDINNFPYAKEIFKEAAASGAYIRRYGDAPEFLFSKADLGDTLIAKDGIVNLYTLAYIPDNQDITVNYEIDGTWYHSSNQIPYKCRFEIDSVSDGAHTLKIYGSGETKTYSFIKRGQCMCFGAEPDTSMELPKAPEKEITVTVNGEQLAFDQPPVIEEGRTLVPMRAIFEALGAEVNWNDNTKTAFATIDDITVSLSIDDYYMYRKQRGKSEEEIELDVPAKLISDRTMVPARAIAEAFGANVQWDGDTRTVDITE